MEAMGSQMRFGTNEEIFGEGEPAEYVYKVIKGAVRTYKILSDGRRQIGGFYLPGDIFGLLSAGSSPTHDQLLGEFQIPEMPDHR